MKQHEQGEIRPYQHECEYITSVAELLLKQDIDVVACNGDAVDVLNLEYLPVRGIINYGEILLACQEHDLFEDLAPVAGLGILRALDARTTLVLTPSNDAGLKIMEVNDASDYNDEEYAHPLRIYLGGENRDTVNVDDDMLALTIIAPAEYLSFQYDGTQGDAESVRKRTQIIEFYESF